MKGIAIVPNWAKDNTKAVVQQVTAFLEEQKISVFLVKNTEHKETGLTDLRVDKNILSQWKNKVDMVIVIGGDGTILNTARQVASINMPILGINVGHKGFLAEIEPGDPFSFLKKAVEGNYQISKRMMLSADVYRGDEKVAACLALNDIVVSKGPFSRIIRLDAFVSSDFLESYPGDGLIISSPTGSTGYSLSAGGPIVNPELNLLIITPICPHKLYSRSVIVSEREKIKLKVQSYHTDIVLTVDGQIGFSLQGGDVIFVEKASCLTQLITFPDNTFYKLLHRKLKDT